MYSTYLKFHVISLILLYILVSNLLKSGYSIFVHQKEGVAPTSWAILLWFANIVNPLTEIVIKNKKCPQAPNMKQYIVPGAKKRDARPLQGSKVTGIIGEI